MLWQISHGGKYFVAMPEHFTHSGKHLAWEHALQLSLVGTKQGMMHWCGRGSKCPKNAKGVPNKKNQLVCLDNFFMTSDKRKVYTHRENFHISEAFGVNFCTIVFFSSYQIFVKKKKLSYGIQNFDNMREIHKKSKKNRLTGAFR